MIKTSAFLKRYNKVLNQLNFPGLNIILAIKNSDILRQLQHQQTAGQATVERIGTLRTTKGNETAHAYKWRKWVRYTKQRHMIRMDNYNIQEGDEVELFAGKDKGKRGIVKQIFRDDTFPKVTVEGLNLTKRIYPADKDTQTISYFEAKFSYFDVKLIDPETEMPVLTKTQYLEDGTKVRVSYGLEASGNIIPYKNDQDVKFKDYALEKDTPQEVAKKVTFKNIEEDFKYFAQLERKLPDYYAKKVKKYPNPSI